jgi:hypothetical protein
MSNISANISELDFIEIEKKILEKTINDNINELYIQLKSKKNKEGKIKTEIIDNSSRLLPSTDIKINVMKKIMKILIGRKFGISHTELAKILKINRKNLSKYLQLLLEKRWIYRSEGEGKYFISYFFIMKSQYYEDIWAFKRNISSEFGFSLFPRDEFKNFTFGNSIYPIGEKMVYFANKIGSIFILLSLFIMDQRNDPFKDYKLDTNKEKDLITMKWISDIISKLVPTWIEEFRWTIFLPLASYIREKVEEDSGKTMSLENYKKIKNLIEPSNNGQILTLRSELVNILFTIFEELYPSMYEIYENVKEQTQKEIEVEKNRLNYERKRFITSLICNHNFSYLGNVYWEDNNKKIKHCRLCHESFMK